MFIYSLIVFILGGHYSFAPRKNSLMMLMQETWIYYFGLRASKIGESKGERAKCRRQLINLKRFIDCDQFFAVYASQTTKLETC